MIDRSSAAARWAFAPALIAPALAYHPGLFVTAVLTQQFDDILVASQRRPMQRRPAVVVLGIDISAVRQQQLDDSLVASNRRIEQGRLATVVLGIGIRTVR